jgi:hypothetical protein
MSRQVKLMWVPAIAAVCVAASLFAPPSWAATRSVTCSGDITSALSGAVSASADGDTVSISAGSCSMQRISINDKNITIQGAGKDRTLITAEGGFGEIVTNGAKSPQWKLKGFKLSGSAGHTQAVVVWADQAAAWRGPFLIYDVEFYYPNNSGQGIAIYGPVFGVISNSKFTNGIESAILTGLQLTSSLEPGSSINNLQGSYAASLAYRPGASDYLYIEDSTFVGTSSGGIAAIDTGYTGGRIVFRNNTLQRAALYAHWTSGSSWNSLWWEVYNNTFIWDGDAGYAPMRLQGGGTGLIYNNTIIGFGNNSIQLGEQRLHDRSPAPLNLCGGSNAWDGNADSSVSGWPCLSQTGRDAGRTMAQILAGNRQASFPLYVWNNGSQAKCANSAASGSACDNSFGVQSLDGNFFKSTPHSTSGFGNGDVDWCKSSSKPSSCGTHSLAYTPYTYPHPLTQGSSQAAAPAALAAPSNLRVQ